MNGDKLANVVVVTDFEPCALAVKLQVLRWKSDRCERTDAVVRSQAGWALQRHGRDEFAVLAEFNVGANRAIWPDLAGIRDSYTRVNDRSGMNVGWRGCGFGVSAHLPADSGGRSMIWQVKVASQANFSPM